MSFTSKLYSLISFKSLKDLEKSRRFPGKFQEKVFRSLICSGKESSFGIEHNFSKINSITKFQEQVPLRDYNSFEPYINRIRSGEHYVLWNQKVKWFAKSSGTSSSKSKFIPVTPDSLYKCHYEGITKLLATYVTQHPSSKLFDGKALTLGGSMKLDEIGIGKSFYGDLSAILLKNSSFIVEKRRIPHRDIALIPNFEEKVDAICRIAAKYNVTNFSGVPSWNLILLNKILEYNNKSNLLEIWPNLELFMHGGINFEPYRQQFKQIIPKDDMNYRENYNASEGYFAFQDDPKDQAMLLTLDNGVFYEFIPMDKLDKAIAGNYLDFKTIEDVQAGINYALVISTNSGLWRYLIGDCVMFTSLFPHKIIITGRTQLFINTFGEELMISNAENALKVACDKHSSFVSEYCVAPIFMESTSKGAHQWAIEFEKPPSSFEKFADTLDSALCNINSDYEAKRSNNATMNRLTITPLKNGCFYQWLTDKNKVGGQNKVPRLSNDRHLIEELIAINDRL